jgi:hypothetical protein
MNPELTRLRARYAKAIHEHRNVGQSYERLRTALHDELTHELCMRQARAALADLQHKRRDILTLRETMAFGGPR